LNNHGPHEASIVGERGSVALSRIGRLLGVVLGTGGRVVLALRRKKWGKGHLVAKSKEGHQGKSIPAPWSFL